MNIKREKNGQYNITGITYGRLLAIQRALRVQLNTEGLSAVGEDVLMVINAAITDKKKPEVTK